MYRKILSLIILTILFSSFCFASGNDIVKQYEKLYREGRYQEIVDKSAPKVYEYNFVKPSTIINEDNIAQLTNILADSYRMLGKYTQASLWYGINTDIYDDEYAGYKFKMLWNISEVKGKMILSDKKDINEILLHYDGRFGKNPLPGYTLNAILVRLLSEIKINNKLQYLSEYASHDKNNDWLTSLTRYCAGDITLKEFLKTVPDKYLVTAYTLAGLSLEERRDIEKARELYRLAIEQQDSDNIEILLAQNRLGILSLEMIYRTTTDNNGYTVTSLEYVDKIKSSSAKLEGKRLYSIRNMIDEDPKTAWVEGKNDEGINEWVEFTFGDKLNSLYDFNSDGRKINSINIINGYAKSEALYQANNRVKKIRISFDDGTSFIADLKDGKLQPQKITLSETKKVKKVKITILDVYKGSKYDDTCISEISFK